MNKGVWDIVRAQFVTSAVKAEQYPSPQMIEAARSAAATGWHV